MMTLAILITIILGALAIFQILLVCGLSLGRFAWGGQHEVLPARLRIGSLASILIYGLFAIVALSKVDAINIITSQTLLDVSLWTITAYLALGVLLNAMSRSKPERYTMTPVTMVLFAGFMALALA